MTTLVLHIGSPKAGSSAIQTSLLRARWGAAWAGIPPNPYGKPYPSGFIAGLYLKPKALPRFLAQRQQQDSERFERDLSRYRRLIRRCVQPRWHKPPKALILSCEYLWRLPQSSVEALRRDFEDLGCNQFLVVAYVREPGSLYGSALQQWSRLSTNLQRFDPLVWRYELRQRLQTWHSVFGESLVVRPFERGQLPDGCVVRDFQNQLVHGLADLPGWPDLTPVADVNRSATTEELLAMHTKMAHGVHPSHQSWAHSAGSLTRLWDELTTRTEDQSGTPIRVRAEVLHLIRQRHREDLCWLFDRHGVQFKSLSESPYQHVDHHDLWKASETPLQLLDLIEAPLDQDLLQSLCDYLCEIGDN